MTVFSISELSDTGTIQQFLNSDINYAAYAIGDLEPPYSDSANWFGASLDGELQGLALVYTALHPQVLFLQGQESALSALLLHGVGPDQVFFTIQPEIENLLDNFYVLEKTFQMFRMRVNSGIFKPLEKSTGMPDPTAIDLDGAESIERLLEIAADADGRDMRDVAFSRDMLNEGHYFGIFDGADLVAVAGTHITAPHAGMAAVGNVVVHPEFRRRGYGVAVSNSVTESLIGAGFELIVLNVRQNNTAAIRTYKKLGYKQMCPFIEGVASRR
jgi:GNAT superfamily N-acetyltransferase